MRIWKTTLGDIFERGTRRRSIAPRDILFEAQLPFLRPKFGKWLSNIVRPTDGGPYVFECEFPQHVSIREFRDKILPGNWGDFEVVKLTVNCEGTKGEWPTARVYVDVSK